MELFVRVHRPGHGHADVRVEIDPDQPSARLAMDVAEHIGDVRPGAPRLLLVRTGAILDPDRPVGESGLVSGDELVLGPTAVATPPPPTPVRAVSVDVLAGPDSGHSAPLDRGSHLLGRGENCDIIVTDPTVSRSHLRVDVGADWAVTITPDPTAQNALRINGVKMAEPSAVTGDDVITVGATSLAFREFIRATDTAIDRLGQIEFHRTPYRPERVQERKLEPLGPPPTTPERRRFQLLAVLAPLGAGLTMFAFSGQPQFLLLTLMSPIAMVANFFEDRRSGRHRHVKAVETYRQRIERRRHEIDAALAEERVERVRSAPDLADLARRAELRTIDLWPRGRDAPDFLTVRIGVGDAPSRLTVENQRGQDPTDDDGLVAELEEALTGHDRLTGVPITVDLAEVGVVGVHGDNSHVDDVAASIAVQVACLHSPEDLIVAAAISSERSFADWLKWLPQARSATSPLAGRHLTSTVDGARRLLAELVEVAELRSSGPDRTTDRRWPWLFVVLDGDLEPDPGLVSRLLDLCPDAGISVMWLCSSESRVPRQAAAVVDCQLATDGVATLWRTDPEIAPLEVDLGRVHPDVADRVARSLAPVRDASVANATTAIPRTAPLLTVLGEDHPDAAWVVARWMTNRPYGLDHPVGLAADGVFHLDLVADGPHALIGGTSGAGKSELLQSMVASLVTCYPPTRLNFLFVDYKGGASSTVFRDVPHTVGYVTNLNADLALRALTSLRAELNRRMQVMEGRAKDLEEMLAKHPDEAPASLIIVVDEFATLVKEIPEFVAGIVDIAQRGRSLGIHLVLATQRPSGSVNDNILANTNLRVSLRMLDRAESNAVIDSPEAADIPVPLRGRAYARLGPRELMPFQSAYASAPMIASDHESPTIVEEFGLEPTAHRVRAVTDVAIDQAAPAATHLDVLIDAVVAAAATCDFPPARSPWRETLPDLVTVDALLDDDRTEPSDGSDRHALAGRMITLGLIDDPEHQDQYPAMVDLEDGGGLLVYGSGGSGRTTLLRTVAVAATAEAGTDEVVVFGIDFASRALRGLEPLPHVAAIGTGDDLEAVTRIVALLDGEVERRRGALAELQAETLTAYRERGGELPRVLLLVDGYPNMVAAFSGGGYGNPLDQWLEKFHRIVLDGRQVGIHVVLTADRRGGVNPLVQSAVSNRVVLRQSEESGYTDHGIPMARARGLDLAPGRGLWQGDGLVQIACVSTEPDGASQAAEIARRAHDLLAAGAGEPAVRTAPLPELVELTADQRRANELEVVLGIADLTLDPVTIDLSHSHAVIAGLPRSGRSTAAALVAAGLLADGIEVWAVGPAGSPLASVAGLGRAAFGRTDTIAPVLDELATVSESLPGPRPRVLVVDDLDALEDTSLTGLWERLVRVDDLRIVATIESRSLGGFSMNAMLNEVRKARRALHLQPDDAVEFFQTTGVKAPIRPGTPMPPGRGVLVVDRRPTMVQVGLPILSTTTNPEKV
ncbi:MAG TPA: FtsK/SpoIIIE domain-containing protein [Microthrixaceae bacterium]|nr:FtsK/SpoIIIE domain-containing protein [Microthrixaceae bacterium]